jgi:hypothetical protein
MFFVCSALFSYILFAFGMADSKVENLRSPSGDSSNSYKMGCLVKAASVEI